jgi:hypothetical protein
MTTSDEEWAVRRVKTQIIEHVDAVEKRLMARIDRLEVLLTEIAETMKT